MSQSWHWPASGQGQGSVGPEAGVGLLEGGLKGLAASQHEGSSQTRDQTHVSCNGRQILYL